jgi:hypothetical protein
VQSYDGEWAEDAMCGTGKLTWRDGSVYVGLFKDGLMWGKCQYDRVDEAGDLRCVSALQLSPI